MGSPRLLLPLLLVLSLVALACADGRSGRRSTGRDGGTPRIDGGGTSDGGGTDAGSGFDAGPRVDAGAGVDAGRGCPSGQMMCEGACRDVAIDPAYCGDCVTSCSTGEVCSGGTCGLSCSGGTTPCARSCVDTDTDESNCGGCGTTCAADQTCTGGSCTDICSGDTTWCSGTCVDTDTDESHCGDCTTVCGSGETCTGGSCMGASTNGCADGSVEVEWSSRYHGCRGPESTWGHYDDNIATYCASGWTMADSSVVNDVLTGPGYTDDVRYAFNGDGCRGYDWYVTRYDSYSQARSECGWLDSHHWSYASSARSGVAHGIVCEKTP